MQKRRLPILLPVMVTLALPGIAVAERPATHAEFTAINRVFKATEQSLHVNLIWVKVSTRGPFALAYLRGTGQTSVAVLRYSRSHWKDLAVVSDEGLRCGLVPKPVIADLHIERYNEGPHPCEP